MPPRVAAVTMAYNEPAYLPLWLRHYARQVGADHCYVVDHGSTERIDVPPGVNILRVPRSAHDDVKRALFVSSFVEGLLEYYEWVIHTDVDELVLAHPEYHGDLTTFCQVSAVDTVTTIGFDVQQVPSLEAPLNSNQSLGDQRGWVRFTSAMCKPVLTRQPLIWSPGFHCADTQMVFDRLYLFHLHWADHDVGLARLAKTRVMPWADAAFGAHQRISDAQWSEVFNGMAAFPRQTDVSFEPSSPLLSEWLERTQQSSSSREHEPYTLDLHINAAELWAIPACFRARL